MGLSGLLAGSVIPRKQEAVRMDITWLPCISCDSQIKLTPEAYSLLLPSPKALLMSLSAYRGQAVSETMAKHHTGYNQEGWDSGELASMSPGVP